LDYVLVFSDLHVYDLVFDLPHEGFLVFLSDDFLKIDNFDCKRQTGSLIESHVDLTKDALTQLVGPTE
jgi:hypothetical protein